MQSGKYIGPHRSIRHDWTHFGDTGLNIRLRRAMARLGTIGLLAAVCGTLGAQPLVKERTHYYDVHGRDIADLYAELAAKGPSDGTGKRFDGLTAWEVSWNTTYETTGQQCRVAGHEVKLDLTITLPRWAGRGNASKRDIAHWDGFIGALTEHENGHRDIARQSARDVSKLLAEFPAQSDCETLAREVDRRASALMKEAQVASAHFDEETEHGLRQGVVL